MPLRRERLGAQLGPARACAEAALGVRAEVVGKVEADEALLAEQLHVDAPQGGGEQRLVVEVELGVGEAHGLRQATPQLGVGDGLPERRDGGLVPAEVEVAPGRHHVEVLHLGGGGEHDVGEARRVGHQLLADHGEQVVTGEALAHEPAVGDRHGGVAVPHEQGMDADRRVGEGPTEVVHADGAGRVGDVEDRVVDLLAEPAADRPGQTSAEVAPGAGEHRQAGEGAEEHRAVLVVLGPDERADEGRPRGAVGVGQLLDLAGVEAAGGSGPFRVSTRPPARRARRSRRRSGRRSRGRSGRRARARA